MTRIGTVWDRTTEVLRGRGGMLAGIAGLTIVLPELVRGAITLALVEPGNAPGAGTALVVALIGLVVVGLTIFGQLSLTAAATDPATLQRDAFAIGARRFWPAIGLYVLIGLAALVAFLPLLAIVGVGNLDFSSMRRGVMPAIPGGVGAVLVLYVLVFFALALWVSARLFVLNPVIVNERLGIGSFRRSWTLTRGSALRIIGFLLLVGIVYGVALLAVQGVLTLLLRLALGADKQLLVAYIAAVVGSLVTAAYTVVLTTFAAQFYVAARGEDYGDVFA